MSELQLEQIERVMRDDPSRYHRDQAMQERYHALLRRDPALRMSKAELLRHATEAEAHDKNLGRKPLADMGSDELYAHRLEQLKARDHGAIYRRIIADREEDDPS